MDKWLPPLIILWEHSGRAGTSVKGLMSHLMHLPRSKFTYKRGEHETACDFENTLLFPRTTSCGDNNRVSHPCPITLTKPQAGNVEPVGWQQGQQSSRQESHVFRSESALHSNSVVPWLAAAKLKSKLQDHVSVVEFARVSTGLLGSLRCASTRSSATTSAQDLLNHALASRWLFRKIVRIQAVTLQSLTGSYGAALIESALT
eukprot:405966-Amphidinium_carterae.1